MLMFDLCIFITNSSITWYVSLPLQNPEAPIIYTAYHCIFFFGSLCLFFFQCPFFTLTFPNLWFVSSFAEILFSLCSHLYNFSLFPLLICISNPFVEPDILAHKTNVILFSSELSLVFYSVGFLPSKMILSLCLDFPSQGIFWGLFWAGYKYY